MRDKAIEIYSAMSENDQVLFLAKLAFELTVWSRDAYRSLTNDASVSAELLEAHNELRHRAAAHLVHILNANDQRYPDDVFINILFDFSTVAGCGPKLERFFCNYLHRDSW